MKDLSKNDVEMAIAEITHNIECVEEARQNAPIEEKRKFNAEKGRLTKLLNKYVQMRKEVK